MSDISSAVVTWNVLLERAAREGVHALSLREQVVLRVNTALCDLENGGMSGFLYNRAPRRDHSEWSEVRDVVEALAEVGATRLSSALAALVPLLERNASLSQGTWAAVLAPVAGHPAMAEAEAMASAQASQLWLLLEDFTNEKVA